jgi:MFS transporter, DHA2 family, glioxin efflux transporter
LEAIISTAIPTITKRFHSEDQVGWYGSAFFMCLAAFQAFWGKAYKFFPLKSVFLTCITIFEIGSLVVAVAPSSTVIIVGRAIQGAGGAGITDGCYIILAFITEPKHLHKVMGVSSLVWTCSSVLGPVLGGVFTQDVSWRWCFFVNLPLGGAAMAIILIFFKTPPHSRVAHAELKEIPLLFDIGGAFLILAAMTCLLLVLQDGGVTYPWNHAVPIGLLVGFILITVVFILLEWKLGDRAMLSFRILKRRTIWSIAAYSVCIQASGFARNYNLPIFFQAVQGVSPTESGIRTLPTVLTICKFSFLLESSPVAYYSNSPFQFRRLPPNR